ncbi:hypothetical protein [Haloarchaeobius sp. HRN-SO-5]|uniref:hypothetical protein n=1 Tax=Haloarchaeobius sp. HRN-SO-5 TaxID=3446118 RepID=UPI003EBAE8F4
MSGPSRRRFVTSLGTTAAALSVAGCVDDTGVGAGPDDTERESTTGTDLRTSDLRLWVPTADAFETADETTLFHLDLDSIRSFRDVLPTGSYDALTNHLLRRDLSGIVAEEETVEVLRMNSAPVTLTRTTLDDATLVDAVVDAGLESAGQYGSTTLYEGDLDGVRSAVAVVDGTVVHAIAADYTTAAEETATATVEAGSPTAVEETATATVEAESPTAVEETETATVSAEETDTTAVEAVLAARAGDESRAFESDEDLPTLYDGVGDAHLRLASTDPRRATSRWGPLEGSTGISYGWRFGREQTTFTAAATYPEGEVADPAAFTDHFATQVVPSNYTGFEGTVEGRVVATTGTVATDEFDLYGGGQSGSGEGTSVSETEGQTRVPRISFAFEYGPDAEAVTVVHQGGDSADANRLTVTVAGTATGTQFADEYDEVTAGDSVTVDVGGAESGADVRVVWTSSDESASAVLAAFQLP